MFDRRTFMLAGAASLAALGADAPLGAQGALVTRRSLRGMRADDPDIEAMRRAVARMKALPSSDPRNWIRFADLHRAFCPHGNWYFLPWHRAYILSFERIVRELSGRPDFALPYWDWTAERRLPAAFAAGDRAANPLFHPRPGVAAGLRLADDMVGGQVISRIMQSPDFEAFGSTRPRGQDSTAVEWQRRPGSKTELEFNPHDGVHQSVGGNMAVVELSSRDPVFFAHHANVDRLWSTWIARGNANSPEPLWRDFVFGSNFVTAGGGRWSPAVGELVSPPALGYRYDDDDSPFAANLELPAGDPVTEMLRAYRRLNSRALARPGAGLQRIELANGMIVNVAAADNDRTASRDTPLAIPVPLGRPLSEIVGAAAHEPRASAARNARAMGRRLTTAEAPRSRRYVWAVIRDLDPPLDKSTRVRVFCNCDDLSPRPRLSDPGYVTSVSFFGSEHASHGPATAAGRAGGTSVCVDLTAALMHMDRPRQFRSDRVTIQLLPECASGEPRVADIRPRRVEVVVL